MRLADKSGDVFQRMSKRTTLADAQHQAGELAAARKSFADAEKLQQEMQPEYPRLYSVWGVRYCDMLLTAGEWREVQQHVRQNLERAEGVHGPSMLEFTLKKLLLGRASLQEAIAKATQASEITSSPYGPAWELIPMSPESAVCVPRRVRGNEKPMQTAKNWLNQAIDGLRNAGTVDYIPRGILARASYYRWSLTFAIQQDPDSVTTAALSYADQNAWRDLQEAHEIAQRGGMRLHVTDYHLESARLALTLLFHPHPSHFIPGNRPLKQQAAEHIEKAKHLIKETGYKRRLLEVTYLEAILSGTDKLG